MPFKTLGPAVMFAGPTTGPSLLIGGGNSLPQGARPARRSACVDPLPGKRPIKLRGQRPGLLRAQAGDLKLGPELPADDRIVDHPPGSGGFNEDDGHAAADVLPGRAPQGRGSPLIQLDLDHGSVFSGLGADLREVGIRDDEFAFQQQGLAIFPLIQPITGGHLPRLLREGGVGVFIDEVELKARDLFRSPAPWHDPSVRLRV